MIRGKSILIKGHTGLIGAALYERLRPFNTVQGKSKSSQDVSLLAGDDKISPADFIIHAAGYAQPSKFLADPVATIRLNTETLQKMIDAMKPGARLLYLSSSEVYSGSPRYIHTEEDIGTTSPASARGCYIEAKRCGEAICHAARAQGKDVFIARVSSVYGPGFRRDDTRVLSQFIRMAVEESYVTPKDGGPARRAWLYLDDCVDMLLRILTGGTQAVYNVGGPHECSIAGLAKKIADFGGAAYRLPRNSGNASNGAPAHVKLDISRYVREFGTPEFVSLDDGLRRTIDWYRRAYDVSPARASA